MLNVKAPSGMASLAFVFDTTGSMWDDLEKVLISFYTVRRQKSGHFLQNLSIFLLKIMSAVLFLTSVTVTIT